MTISPQHGICVLRFVQHAQDPALGQLAACMAEGGSQPKNLYIRLSKGRFLMVGSAKSF